MDRTRTLTVSVTPDEAVASRGDRRALAERLAARSRSWVASRQSALRVTGFRAACGRRSRRGLTLLELILALALTTVLLGAIGMALHLYLHTLDVRRTHVEQAQLARAVLHQIADDLRSVVQYEEFDTAGLEEMIQAAAQAAQQGAGGGGAGDAGSAAGGGGGGDGDSGGGDSGGGDGGRGSAGGGARAGSGAGGDAGGMGEGASAVDLLADLDGGDVSTTDPTQDIASSLTPPAMPGLYGNQYELQLDVSQLPRIEEFQTMMMPTDGVLPTDVPSDVKTVAYYLQGMGVSGGLASGAGASATARGGKQGLVRREQDRAVAQWSAQNGQVDLLGQNSELIAPEVVGLEFQYFDGIQWLPEWDTELYGGVPLAVEIVVAISSNTPRPSSLLPSMTGEDNAGVLYYRLMVRLPTARPIDTSTSMEGLGL